MYDAIDEEGYDSMTRNGFRDDIQRRIAEARARAAAAQAARAGGGTTIMPGNRTVYPSGYAGPAPIMYPAPPPVQTYPLTPLYPVRPPYPAVPSYPPSGYPYGVPPEAYLPPYEMRPPINVGKVLRIVGVAVDCLGAGIAALMPLPDAPQILGQQPTDDENMKRYQEGLAQHAKTDERIRTFAKIVREALSVKL